MDSPRSFTTDDQESLGETAPDADIPLRGPVVLGSVADLKVWLRKARRTNFARTQAEVGNELGVSTSTVWTWESHAHSSVPSMALLAKIAEFCAVEPPIIDPGFVHPGGVIAEPVATPTAGECSTLAAEIRINAQHIATTCFRTAHQRNADMFVDRYVHGHTLRELADMHAVTIERARQIIERMQVTGKSLQLKNDRLLDVASQCDSLQMVTLDLASEALADLLGESMSLERAVDYAEQVTPLRLPIQLQKVDGGETLIVQAGQQDWTKLALAHARRFIRYHGAALLQMVYAEVQGDCTSKVCIDDVRRALETVKGFQWLDETRSWFWLGKEGYPNRILDWVRDMLSVAQAPVDITSIYAGLGRYHLHRAEANGDKAPLALPREVLLKLISASSDFRVTRYDDVCLAREAPTEPTERTVAHRIVDICEANGGVITRAELVSQLVTPGTIALCTLASVLASSPYLRRIDHGVYAVRGRPMDPDRLIEAMRFYRPPQAMAA